MKHSGVSRVSRTIERIASVRRSRRGRRERESLVAEVTAMRMILPRPSRAGADAGGYVRAAAKCLTIAATSPGTVYCAG
jgi:hypothetical protein